MSFKFDMNNPVINSQIAMIKLRLCRLGYIENANDGIYDIETYNAIKNFQRDNGLSITGNIDDITMSKIFEVQNILYAESSRSTRIEIKKSIEENKHFDKSNEDIFKKSNFEINIKYGQGKVITLKDVILYNKDQTIDSNGEAIYDTYQFVANDLID